MDSGSSIVLDSQAGCCRLTAETPVKSTRCEGNTDENDSSWRASETVRVMSAKGQDHHNVRTRIHVVDGRKLEIDDVFPGEVECSIRILIRGDVEVVGVAAGRNITSELFKLIERTRVR